MNPTVPTSHEKNPLRNEIGAYEHDVEMPPIVFRKGDSEVTSSLCVDRVFRPSRIVLTLARNGESATGFAKVTSIRIGDREQLHQDAAASGVLAEAFSPHAFGTELRMPAVAPGTWLALVFKLDGAALIGDDTISIEPRFAGLAIDVVTPSS